MINAECYLSFPCEGVGRVQVQGGFSVGNLNYYEKPLRKTDSRVLLYGISSSTDPRQKISGMTFEKHIGIHRCLSVVFFFFLFSLNANTLTVCEACNYKTIQSALTAANTNDTIEVQKGVYKESPVQIKKPVSLRGINSPTIDGEKKDHVIDILSDGVQIEGFTIKNGGMSDIHEFAGIHADGIKNCNIKNNTLENNAYGIYLAKVETCHLENNTSIGNAVNEVSGGNGIHLWSSNHINIIKNKTSHHRDGIYLEFSTDLLIEDNISTESIRYGLHFMFSSGNKFYRNLFIYNSTGVAIMYSKNIEVKGNFFEKSKDANSYGILLKDITDSEFTNNIFRENTIGITADNATRNKFISNQFLQNGWAFNMMGNCEYNQVTGNNFISMFICFIF
jgi:nitrous oxidase accessory protein